jgi:orotidine 5'-phosphate decarboxylase subfamily 2
MNFQEKLDAVVKKNNSLLCVGLDKGELDFNKKIIEATFDLVCAYKLNTAFYEEKGKGGVEAEKMTCDFIKVNHPEIPIIIDAKRGDIGNTSEAYTKYVFDYLGGDAVTLQPYLGKEANQPFLNFKEKGIFILCRTSNPGAGEFQDLESGGKKLWQIVAENVSKTWNKNNNCLLVAGATYPEELGEIRKIVGEMTLLVPGIGAQGGDIEKTVKAGLNSKKAGMIINSSRGIIFAQDPRAEAKKLRDEINKYR